MTIPLHRKESVDLVSCVVYLRPVSGNVTLLKLELHCDYLLRARLLLGQTLCYRQRIKKTAPLSNMTPLQPVQISIYQTFKQIILIIYKAAPFELASLIFLSIITGSGPSASLFLNKIIIDELIQLAIKKSPDAFNTLLSEPKLLFSLALMLIINILVDSLRPVSNIIFPTLKEAVEGFIKSKVISKVAQFNDLALFETPYLLNILKLAERGWLNSTNTDWNATCIKFL